MRGPMSDAAIELFFWGVRNPTVALAVVLAWSVPWWVGVFHIIKWMLP